MIRNLFLALLIGGTALAACANPNAPDDATHVILPLSDGNIWIGDAVDTDSTGARIRTRTDTTMTHGERIYGSDHFLLGNRYDGMRNAPGGLHVWSGESARDEWQLLPYPASPGRTITRTFADSVGGGTLSVTVAAIDESVTVPAGSFVCYRYHITSTANGYEVDAFLAPNVGFVKVVLLDRPGDRYNLGGSEWQLRQYRVR